MKRFKNILVAVDLRYTDQFVSTALSLPCAEAVECAMSLAKCNGARITFFHAFDVSDATQRLLSELGVDEKAREAVAGFLNEVADRATAQGLNSEVIVGRGRSWIEIIRQVIRGQHDLVFAGSQGHDGLPSILAGSTGIKLLRKCPCPVWITKPQANATPTSILVAHCLRPVGDLAMELGCSLAELHQAQLHVLHSLEFPELDSPFPARVPASRAAKYRLNARRHIESQLADYNLTQEPRISVVTTAPDFVVLEEIQEYNVDLLTMGTIARTGIPGLITGNTAERLLPRLPCSVLAVKPPGFETPVTIEDSQ